MVDLQEPPSDDVLWRAWRKGQSPMIKLWVRAQTWFAARKKAATQLGVSVENVVVERVLKGDGE